MPHKAPWDCEIPGTIEDMSRVKGSYYSATQDPYRQKEGDLISSVQGEFCGWSGRSRLERLSYQFVGQMDRPSTSLHSIRSQEIVPLSLRYDEAKHTWKGMPITNSPNIIRRFPMNYIGIDVAKEELSVYDGIKEYTFRNERGCEELKGHLQKTFRSLDNLILIFEATGPYSLYLREFCAHNPVRVYIVNPIKSSSFTKALGNRSKTDTIDTKMLYEFVL